MHVRTIAVGLIALGLAGGAAALATGSATSRNQDTITACQKKYLRVVSDASKCKAGERVVTWSKNGQVGPAGPRRSGGRDRPSRRARPSRTRRGGRSCRVGRQRARSDPRRSRPGWSCGSRRDLPGRAGLRVPLSTR